MAVQNSMQVPPAPALARSPSRGLPLRDRKPIPTARSGADGTRPRVFARKQRRGTIPRSAFLPAPACRWNAEPPTSVLRLRQRPTVLRKVRGSPPSSSQPSVRAESRRLNCPVASLRLRWEVALTWENRRPPKRSAIPSRAHTRKVRPRSLARAPDHGRPLSSPDAAETATPPEKRKMAKGDPKKPKGKMSAYAFFVQTCREEHKKKNPEVPVNFAEFSKKCSERWKTMSSKEKGKFDEMAKADKVRYDREMKDYGPAKGGKKKKDPNAPKRPPSGFFLFCSEFRPKIKSTNPGISIGDVAKKLGEMWNNLTDGEKQPYNNKAAKLKEKYEKDVADYKSKGVFEKAKNAAAAKAAKAAADRKKMEEMDVEDEEDEEDDEEEEEEDDE
ncbi:hypothetical protein lerEdw1_010444 [Lerista edwardsae]|nr:hypothetical protein lerEdw1_010444 [Lerista edwardsae]